ncbi:centromere protein P [Sarcophilus harrisii]|uniref:centromere protein P n=1 Tax=Sarcophilus harrisii TaxID=9305 RepID=UPI001301D72B|nr:centromere protein P [Sarcophilus harrisii]
MVKLFFREEEERRRPREEEERRRRREQLKKEQRQRQEQLLQQEQRRRQEEEQRRRREEEQRRWQRRREELRDLRAEIAALRRRLEQSPAEADPDPAPDPARCFCQENEPPPAGRGESGRALEAQLGGLESGLSFLSEVTGIRITHYSMTRAELPGGTEGAQESGPRILRKGRLAGDCRDVTFHLEFQLLETQGEENPSAAITELSIILEPLEYSELSRFVARTEEKRDLFGFFRSLHFFLEWCEYRKRTFQYFKEKHGAVVQLPGGPAGDSMGLQSLRVPGFELLVVWTVHIDEDGQVLPRLDLLTKVPEPALALDSRKVVAAPRFGPPIWGGGGRAASGRPREDHPGPRNWACHELAALALISGVGPGTAVGWPGGNLDTSSGVGSGRRRGAERTDPSP